MNSMVSRWLSWRLAPPGRRRFDPARTDSSWRMTGWADVLTSVTRWPFCPAAMVGTDVRVTAPPLVLLRLTLVAVMGMVAAAVAMVAVVGVHTVDEALRMPMLVVPPEAAPTSR